MSFSDMDSQGISHLFLSLLKSLLLNFIIRFLLNRNTSILPSFFWNLYIWTSFVYYSFITMLLRHKKLDSFSVVLQWHFNLIMCGFLHFWTNNQVFKYFTFYFNLFYFQTIERCTDISSLLALVSTSVCPCELSVFTLISLIGFSLKPEQYYWLCVCLSFNYTI